MGCLRPTTVQPAFRVLFAAYNLGAQAAPGACLVPHPSQSSNKSRTRHDAGSCFAIAVLLRESPHAVCMELARRSCYVLVSLVLLKEKCSLPTGTTTALVVNKAPRPSTLCRYREAALKTMAIVIMTFNDYGTECGLLGFHLFIRSSHIAFRSTV